LEHGGKWRLSRCKVAECNEVIEGEPTTPFQYYKSAQSQNSFFWQDYRIEFSGY